MLAKKFRLTPIEFYHNPKKSLKLKCFFGFISIKHAGNNFPRFVITVPLSVDKRSVYRHRTKRIIIEVLKQYLPRFKQNVDVLIKATEILRAADRLIVTKEIGRLLKENSLI